MKKLKAMLMVAACVAALGMGAGTVQAQGRNFDPAQWRQARLDRYKEEMAVTDDSEWKLISAAIGKVMDAEQAVMGDRVRGMFGGRRNRDNSSGDSNGSSNNSRRRGPFGNPSPEAEDLQKAIDDKASADVIKAKLAKLRDSMAAHEAALTKAQDDLKALLTTRQEAVAVLGGLLK